MSHNPPRSADPNPADPGRVIRASELGQYAYCAKAWWLGSVAGVASTNTEALARGTAAHAAHGRTVWLSSALRWAAIGLVVLAAIIFWLSS